MPEPTLPYAAAPHPASTPPGPPAAPATPVDPALLVEAVDRLADRFRAMAQSRLLGAVPGHASRAAAGLALASDLAAVAQVLEGDRPRPFPNAGAFAAGDQLAVAGHDLAAALAAAGGGRAPVALPVPLGSLRAGTPADAPALLVAAVSAVTATAELCA